MGRVVKKKLKLPKSNHQEEEEEDLKRQPIEVSSDDEEANEDLSLKIVEKARLRACTDGIAVKDGGAEDGVVVDASSSVEPKRRKKSKSTEPPQVVSVCAAKIEQAAETRKSLEAQSVEAEELLDTNLVEKSDNVVLRKLLRGPRYFDPPDSSWGTCYNCGEPGHTAANCTSARRKKPCFVCGSFEHNAKQCKKGKDCFICKKGGHRAKDCPEKTIGGSQNARMCLKCGDSGHDMFSCRNDYPPDELKEIKCYICKCFGHLCCVNNSGAGPREVSCYRCGQSGHSGLACTRLRAESNGMGTPSSCYKCGEEGHFARECASSVKAAKRNRELSNHKGGRSEDKKKHKEVKSAPPNDGGKVRKRKKAPYEGVTSTPKGNKRGGWITEDPRDVYHRKYKANNGWNSPVTPVNTPIWVPIMPANTAILVPPDYGAAGGYASSSHSYNSGRRLHYGNSPSNGSAQYYHHQQGNSPTYGSPQYYNHQNRYSASRFSNPSTDGTGPYRPNKYTKWY